MISSQRMNQGTERNKRGEEYAEDRIFWSANDVIEDWAASLRIHWRRRRRENGCVSLCWGEREEKSKRATDWATDGGVVVGWSVFVSLKGVTSAVGVTVGGEWICGPHSSFTCFNSPIRIFKSFPYTRILIRKINIISSLNTERESEINSSSFRQHHLKIYYFSCIVWNIF